MFGLSSVFGFSISACCNFVWRTLCTSCSHVNLHVDTYNRYLAYHLFDKVLFHFYKEYWHDSLCFVYKPYSLVFVTISFFSERLGGLIYEGAYTWTTERRDFCKWHTEIRIFPSTMPLPFWIICHRLRFHSATTG